MRAGARYGGSAGRGRSHAGEKRGGEAAETVRRRVRQRASLCVGRQGRRPGYGVLDSYLTKDVSLLLCVCDCTFFVGSVNLLVVIICVTRVPTYAHTLLCNTCAFCIPDTNVGSGVNERAAGRDVPPARYSRPCNAAVDKPGAVHWRCDRKGAPLYRYGLRREVYGYMFICAMQCFGVMFLYCTHSRVPAAVLEV